MMQSREISGSGNSHNPWLPEVRKFYTYPISSSLLVSILYLLASVEGSWARWAAGINKSGDSYFLSSDKIIKVILVIFCCRLWWKFLWSVAPNLMKMAVGLVWISYKYTTGAVITLMEKNRRRVTDLVWMCSFLFILNGTQGETGTVVRTSCQAIESSI